MTGDHQPPDTDKSLAERLNIDFALQAAALGVWEIDPQTNQVLWDQRCRALVGLDVDEPLSFEATIQYIHPDDLTRVLAAIRRAMAPRSDGVFDETYRTLGADHGRLRWVRFWGQGYFTPEGALYRFAGVAQDVTQPVKAQRALTESESLLELLRDTVPAMIFYLDAEQHYRSYNRVFRDWFGVDATEVVGKTVREFLGEAAYQTVLPHLAKAYAGQREQYELYAPGRMQTGRWLSTVYTPHTTEQGEVLGVIVHSTDITQSKLDEIELRNSEARFRMLVEEAPVATCLFIGPQMRIEVVNNVMLAYWGRDKGVIGMPLAEALPELKGQPHLQILDEVFTTGRTYEASQVQATLLVKGELKTYYFDLVHKPLRNADGGVYGIMDMSLDVTEQVLARQQLEASEAQLRSLVESAPFPIGVYTGPDMIIQLANQSIMDAWGKGNDVIGKRYKALLPELADQSIFEQLDAVYTTGVAFHAQNQRVDLVVDGRRQPYYFKYSFTPLFDAQGRVYGVMNTAAEVTDLIVTQQKLAASEARYRSLSDALEQQVQNRTEELAAANEELATTNEELAANNEEYAAINEELEEANGLLIRSNDNLQQFAYVASHDLQEPLRKIQQFGGLLKERFADQLGGGTEYLDRMQLAASRMSTLIKDLLAFSRISTRREANAVVSLTDVINTVLNDLDLVIQETRAELLIEPLPSVQGDPVQLGQLFQNLLSNALKFRRNDQAGVPIAPVIRINAGWVAADNLPAKITPGRRVEAYYRFDVTDNGVGFNEKYLDRIFQIFQRLYGKSEYVGTGIGLAICEKVVTNHGGAITASSQPGQGATFSVYLPV